MTPLTDGDDFFDDPDYPFDPNFDWNRTYTWDEVHPCYRDPLPADTTIEIPSHMDVADQLSMPPPSQDITVKPCPPRHIDNAPVAINTSAEAPHSCHPHRNSAPSYEGRQVRHNPRPKYYPTPPCCTPPNNGHVPSVRKPPNIPKVPRVHSNPCSFHHHQSTFRNFQTQTDPPHAPPTPPLTKHPSTSILQLQTVSLDLIPTTLVQLQHLMELLHRRNNAERRIASKLAR
ncbi:hypothetical protein DXG01_006787 [Tephrocybe rancida]|nr:hypothetical protein DXG01_006787 [Tephrocybe rancida]